MPYRKMLNIYAASSYAMLPQVVAYGIAAIAGLGALAILVWTCRKTEDPRWRYAVLATATLLVTPYSWYYELALILPAIWFVLEHGYRKGWLDYERELVAFAFVLAVSLPGPALKAGVSLPFLIMLCASVVVARRVRFELTGGRPSAFSDQGLTPQGAQTAG
jgi:hypothetical protein